MTSAFCDPPARLIEVGSADSGVRLKKSSELSWPYQWVTLSHCWGPKGIEFVLQSSRLEAFQRNIPIECLATNFRDAIVTVRRLSSYFGRLYLWIDALCIVQDSKEDWAIESVKMGHIYSNALCNLLAARGHDSTAGLFEERNQFSSHTCTFQGGPSSCLAGHWQVRNFTSFEETAEKSTLMYRAWVHQELNLSLRKIYFSSDQLYWQCATKLCEEIDPDFQNDGARISPSSLSLFRIAADASLSRDEKNFQYYGTWAHLVENHSTFLITKDEDRLPSVGSLAQVMHSLLEPKDEYIAGIRKRWFWLYILWEVPSTTPEHIIPAQNGSPSWSWSSIKPKSEKARINFEPGAVRQKPNVPNVHPLAEFFDANIELDREDSPFGKTTSVSIKAKAIMLKLRVDVQVDLTKRCKVRPCMYWKDHEITTPLTPLLDYIDGWTTGWHTLYCAVIAHDKSYLEKFNHERLICLLLRKCEDIVATYRRVGFCQIVHIGPDSIWAQALKGQTKNEDLDQDEYHVSHGDAVYTITLI